MKTFITLTEFILAEERKFPKATGSLTLLLTHLENAGKLIAAHVRMSGLADILGATGKINVQNEEVQKLDEYADTVLSRMLLSCGQVRALGSEEQDTLNFSQFKRAPYDVFFDPLDGSSNIDVNVNIGTIFSIYHAGKGQALLSGRKQVAAGYILYGTSVMFVYTTGSSVNGFTLDPASGLFLLSHPNLSLPEKGSIYSINEAYYAKYSPRIKKYLDNQKTKKVKSRYIGSLVADAHRTLIKGGIFLYPTDSAHPAGKERLVYEVNPIAFLIEVAGGVAVDETGKRVLDIVPTELHQRSSVILGSKENVKEFLAMH